MKKKILAVAALVMLTGLYSFTARQRWSEYLDSNGDRVFVLSHGETMLVDGVELTNNDPNPGIQDKYVLCPGDGVNCAGIIKTVGGIEITYSEYKGEGRKNIEKVPDSPH